MSKDIVQFYIKIVQMVTKLICSHCNELGKSQMKAPIRYAYPKSQNLKPLTFAFGPVNSINSEAIISLFSNFDLCGRKLSADYAIKIVNNFTCNQQAPGANVAHSYYTCRYGWVGTCCCCSIIKTSSQHSMGKLSWSLLHRPAVTTSQHLPDCSLIIRLQSA